MAVHWVYLKTIMDDLRTYASAASGDGKRTRPPPESSSTAWGWGATPRIGSQQRYRFVARNNRIRCLRDAPWREVRCRCGRVQIRAQAEGCRSGRFVAALPDRDAGSAFPPPPAEPPCAVTLASLQPTAILPAAWRYQPPAPVPTPGNVANRQALAEKAVPNTDSLDRGGSPTPRALRAGARARLLRRRRTSRGDAPTR